MPTIIYKDPVSLAAGDLRSAVTILHRTTTTDASGTVVSWSTFKSNVRCKIEPLRGVELLKSGVDTTQLYCTITARFDPAITTQMRVQTLDGDVFIIQAIENVLRRNVIMRMTCMGVATE